MPLIDPPRNPFDLRTWLKDLRDYVNILDDEIDNSATDFLSLTDVPSDYTGSGGYVVKVNNTEDGLEFAAASGLGDMIAATYDPQGISSDAFDVDNHTDGITNKVFTATEKTKLAGIATGAEVNVNADWNAVSGDAQILNKPTIPVVSDVAYDATSWNNNPDAPSKNAVRDKIETMDAAIALNTAKVTNATHTGDATGSGALTVVALRGVSLDSTVGTPADGNILVYRSAGSDWVLESKPTSSGSPAWGDITGTLSAQTDLQTALDGKVDGVTGTGLISVDNTDPLNPIISTTAEANVNADWNAVSGDAEILNKPVIITVSDDPYDATSWNGNTDAPTKNAIRDKLETMSGGGGTWGSITGTLSDQTDLDAALDGKLSSVVAGTNITIDNTDPINPIINASGGGGGDIVIEDANNNSVSQGLRITKNTTGTPDSGIGVRIQAAVETSTTEDVNIGALNFFWLNSNHVSRSGCLDINVNNSGGSRRVARFLPEGDTGSLLLGTESTDAKLGVFQNGNSVIAGFDSNTSDGRAFIRISRFGNPYMYLGVAGPSYASPGTKQIYEEDAFIETDAPNFVLYNPNKIKFVDFSSLIGAVSNLGFEVPEGSAYNIGEPEVEGTWRFARESDDLVVQRYESGVWTTKHTFTAI